MRRVDLRESLQVHSASFIYPAGLPGSSILEQGQHDKSAWDADVASFPDAYSFLGQDYSDGN